MNWQVIQGDCIEVMARLPEQGIDLVLTDPPYGTTACKWDAVIPFTEMWTSLLRLTKPNGAMIFTSSQPFTAALVMSNAQMFRHEWIYKKQCASNFAQATIAPMKEHENVLVFGQKQVRYFPIKEARQGSGAQRAKYAYSDRSRHAVGAFVNHFHGEYDKDNDSGNDELRYPSSIQTFNNRAKGDRGYHPTQKPVQLLRYLIRTYSNEGDTVLDFTCGSGSTGVACLLENRNFIGIEQDERYVEVARQRLIETAVQDREAMGE